MIDRRDIDKRAEALRRALHARLGVQGRDLGQALDRAAARLPRRVRAQARFLRKAETMAAHPKLARQITPAQVRAAYEGVMAYLEQIDVADARKGRILGILAMIAFRLLCVAVAVVWYLWWRGYV